MSTRVQQAVENRIGIGRKKERRWEKREQKKRGEKEGKEKGRANARKNCRGLIGTDRGVIRRVGRVGVVQL